VKQRILLLGGPLNARILRLEEGGIAYAHRPYAPDPDFYVQYFTDDDAIYKELELLRSLYGEEGEAFANRVVDGTVGPLIVFYGRDFNGSYPWFFRIYVDVETCEVFALRDNRSSVFESIRASRLIELAGSSELLRADTDPKASARQVKSFVSDPVVTSYAASLFDLNDDEIISVAEFSSVCREIAGRELGPDATVIDKVNQQVFQVVVDEMRLNPVDDTIQDGVRIDELTGDPAGLFSYENTCDYTQYVVGPPGVGTALCTKLNKAADAEQAGLIEERNLIVSDAQHQIQNLSGTAFSVEEADRLDLLYEIQKSE
jgi:hypothetical protein